jgi:hypothetical protein
MENAEARTPTLLSPNLITTDPDPLIASTTGLFLCGCFWVAQRFSAAMMTPP